MRLLRLAGLFLLLGPGAALASPGKDCSLPMGWSAVAETNAHIVVFGELHGTAQSPQMVADTVCALAGNGESVLLAVELNATANRALQQVWNGPDDGFPDRLIETMPGWKGRQDGVASKAMLAMLTWLHTVKGKGAAIDVVAFNGIRDDAQKKRLADLPAAGPHEAAQAENILRAVKTGEYDHVIVLVGSMHARGGPVDWGQGPYRPMKMHLDPDDTISLRMTYSAGTGWNCQMTGKGEPGAPISPEDLDCAAHEVRDPWGLSGAPRLVLGDLPPSGFDFGDAYDGYYFVGSVTASAPAAPEIDSQEE